MIPAAWGPSLLILAKSGVLSTVSAKYCVLDELVYISRLAFEIKQPPVGLTGEWEAGRMMRRLLLLR